MDLDAAMNDLDEELIRHSRRQRISMIEAAYLKYFLENSSIKDPQSMALIVNSAVKNYLEAWNKLS